MMNDLRDLNVIGAFSLAIAEDMLGSVEREAPESGSAAAVLVLLAHAPGMSVERLRTAVSLSHPGAVRLVDRLEREGLVLRQRSTSDGRAVALHLTRRGEIAKRAIDAARERSLRQAMAVLSAAELRTLGRLSAKMLATMVGSEAQAYRRCRLCAYEACRKCPVEAALPEATS